LLTSAVAEFVAFDITLPSFLAVGRCSLERGHRPLEESLHESVHAFSRELRST
jgi:hypothetical protein